MATKLTIIVLTIAALYLFWLYNEKPPSMGLSEQRFLSPIAAWLKEEGQDNDDLASMLNLLMIKSDENLAKQRWAKEPFYNNNIVDELYVELYFFPMGKEKKVVIRSIDVNSGEVRFWHIDSSGDRKLALSESISLLADSKLYQTHVLYGYGWEN